MTLVRLFLVIIILLLLQTYINCATVLNRDQTPSMDLLPVNDHVSSLTLGYQDNTKTKSIFSL